MKIQTSEPNISKAWKSLIAKHTLEKNNDVKNWSVYFAPTSWKKWITIISLPGKSSILIKIRGSSEKVQYLLSQVRMALLVEVWEIFRPTSKDINPLNQQLLYFRLFSGLDVYLEELKQEEK
jgi:hypothetical protein